MRKNKTAVRCPICGFKEGMCICGELPRVNLNVQLILVQHTLDAIKPSNTGNIIQAITSCKVIRYGGSKNERLEAEQIADLGLILYPAASALTLSRELWEIKGRPPLIAIDGTWKQAARVASKLKKTSSSENFVKLRGNFKSFYRLRNSGMANRLCTGEAISEALKILGEDAEKIDMGLSLFIEKNLKLRGKLNKI